MVDPGLLLQGKKKETRAHVEEAQNQMYGLVETRPYA